MRRLRALTVFHACRIAYIECGSATLALQLKSYFESQCVRIYAPTLRSRA